MRAQYPLPHGQRVGWLVGWLLPLCPGARPGPPRLEATGGKRARGGGGGGGQAGLWGPGRTLLAAGPLWDQCCLLSTIQMTIGVAEFTDIALLCNVL